MHSCSGEQAGSQCWLRHLNVHGLQGVPMLTKPNLQCLRRISCAVQANTL